MFVTPVKKETQIINCCPHTVSVYSGAVFDPATGKHKGGKEILTVPASGFLASAKSAVEVLPPMTVNGVTVPALKRTFSKVSELPDDNKWYIVSSVFAQAAKELGKDVTHLLTPYGNVVDESGKIIGCTALVCYDPAPMEPAMM